MPRKLKEIFLMKFDSKAAKTLARNLLNALVLFAILWGLLACVMPAIYGTESCCLTLFERQKGTICPETLHVAVREPFFDHRQFIVFIHSDAEIPEGALSVELAPDSRKNLQTEVRTGSVFADHPDDPDLPPALRFALGSGDLPYTLDFRRTNPPRGRRFSAPPDNLSFAIRLDPDVLKDVSKVRLFCPDVARADIVCAEYDCARRNPAPQVESVLWNVNGGVRVKLKPGSVFIEDLKPDFVLSGKILLISFAELLLAAFFLAYFKWAPTGPNGPGTMRAFGKGFALFFGGVVVVRMVNIQTGITILGLEIQSRAGTLPLAGLTVLYWGMSIMLFAGVLICAVLAVRMLVRRARHGSAVRLSFLPALFLIAAACLTVRAQYAKHYARERFRAQVCHQNAQAQKDAPSSVPAVPPEETGETGRN